MAHFPTTIFKQDLYPPRCLLAGFALHKNDTVIIAIITIIIISSSSSIIVALSDMTFADDWT